MDCGQKGRWKKKNTLGFVPSLTSRPTDALFITEKMIGLLTAGSSLAAFVGQPFGTSTLSHSRTAPQAAVMMAGMPLPAGSLVALTTPMKENGDVDIPTLRKLLQWHKKDTLYIILLYIKETESGRNKARSRCPLVQFVRL